MAFQKRFYRHRGITILQKRDPGIARIRRSKVALVLAGGAITGGAFKVGGLRALDEMFVCRRSPGGGRAPFALNDCDIFVGLSAGSVLATVLAAGVSPEEILRIVMGTSHIYEPFGRRDFMAPEPGEWLRRIGGMLAHEETLFTNWLSGATDAETIAPFTLRKTLLKMVVSLARGVPVGLFSTARLGAYLRRNMRRAGLGDSFAELYEKTGKELLLTAVDINRGEMLVFAHDEPYGGLPISDAIRASCALPGWYQPVRVPNPRAAEPREPALLDLVDGGLVRTANVRLAVEKGADLVICYNPFTRIRYERQGRSLVDHGPYALASQLFRVLLGARLDLAKELLYRDETIDADVIFIEPADDDYVFFRMNPLRHGNQPAAAAHGHRAIRAAVQANQGHLAEVFASHGIDVTPPPEGDEPWRGEEVSPHDLRESRGRFTR
ncbi:MAG TPA: patatin-like phospholipase family protein [Haliangiales bacterium]|nr:patatin-like phospholipase family protein [Haliangiales bacterium]